MLFPSRPFFRSKFLLALVWLVAGPALAWAQRILPDAQVGVAYSFQITTTPAAPAGTLYAATGLPTGISINASSGLISGTPTTVGTYGGTLSLTEGGLTDNFAIVLVVYPALGTPAITSATTLSATVGTAISTYTVTASNSPTSFNVGPLPAGLTLGGTATAPTLSGTPSAAGTYEVLLAANNTSGTGASTILTIVVAAAGPVPVITSPTDATAPLAAVFSYTITASNSPVLFSATGLPLGLTLDSATGVISGTPTIAGVYAVALSATNENGVGASTVLTLLVGSVPTITSAATASATVGSAFNFTLTASNSPTSFNVTGLAPGLSANSTSGALTGTPTTAGAFTVTVSANNATGTGPTSTLTINVAPASSGGGGGGGGATPVAPVITSLTPSFAVVAGAPASFTVVAAGTGTLSYQWRVNGTAIAGATAPTYTIASAQSEQAGVYNVVVANSVGSTTSAGITLAVSALVTPPVITAQPVSQSVPVGASATFAVTAANNPSSYQWFKDGVSLAGATSASLVLNTVRLSDAGSYTVRVSNSAGGVNSAAAVLGVSSRSIAGTYFGSFGGNGGTFALYVRSDRTGVFLGYARTNKIVLLSREVLVDANGGFRTGATVGTSGGPTSSSPRFAAAAVSYVVAGTIGADGAVSGSVSDLGLSFSAPPAASGATAALAGFYQAGAAGSSATSYAIIGAAGEAFVVNVAGASADAGRGSVTAAGVVTVTTESNTSVSGSIQAATVSLTTTLGGSAVTFVGANNDARIDNEKLLNLSTRSHSGTGTNALIAGFVITGTAPKPVLVRGIGPTLAEFGVAGALSAVRLEVFRDTTSYRVGTDWGAAGDAATIAATSARVGAFALAAASRDAALLLTLEPGSYSAVVSGQNNTTGVALVEVYDATAGAIPNAQRVVNISSRAMVGTADLTLIGGFYVSGTVPKRVLIRGIGPSLAQFGVTGTLARPQLLLFKGTATLATNSGWATSPDAAAISAAAVQAGAFALVPGSADAALLVHLDPGSYTAQVVGIDGSTGIALVEIYEVP